MGATHPRLVPPSWLRLPRRTARLRLTAFCGGLFLLSGVALIAVTYVLFEQATKFRKPHLPKVPHTPSIQSLQLPLNPAAAFVGGPVQLTQAQRELAKAQHELATTKPYFLNELPGLAQIQRQLDQAKHQLAQGEHQLAQAVHELAQAGSAQAAQRAADSHQLLVNSGIALAIVAVLAILAGWLVAGRMLRPIRTITRTARRISATSLHERLALQGPEDELKELGDTLDDLFGRLDAAFDAQRHFVANASHELRTPLTAERTLLQVALDDPDTTITAWRSTAEEVLASSDEQARLIEALLTLASSESGLDSHEPVDLAVIARTVLRDRRDIDRLGLHLDTAISSALVEGDPRLLESLVANLVDNAVRHNVAGGRFRVATESKDGKVVIEITNTGPLIAPGEVARLLQPFQRLDPRRSHHKDGHGLGLSIIRAIAAAHGATLSVHPGPEGGLAVAVDFPPSQSRGSIRQPRDERTVSGDETDGAQRDVMKLGPVR
ncbi:MAG: ATP-binding protein [Acidimicrobiales bacterium]